MRRLTVYFLVFIIIVTGCRKIHHVRPVHKIKIMMGTFVEITVHDEDKSIEDIEFAIEAAFDEIDRIDKLASNWTGTSQVALINEKAASQYVRPAPEIIEIIKLAHHISEISDGAFDITISPLLKLWNFTDSLPKIPSESQLSELLQNIDYRNVKINNREEIKFLNKNIQIDLGGIAKGYAVDKGMEKLKINGITDALINAGGDFRAICSELTKGKRKVWIKHPRKRDAMYGYFKLDSGSVATSGDYEQYFIMDSTRYHHILDPGTGYPAQKTISVTIQAQNAATADALATAVFIMGPQKGMDLINKLDHVEGILIFKKDEKLEYIVSEGLFEKFIKLK